MDVLSTLCMDAHLTPEDFQLMTGISRRTFYRYQPAPPCWAVLLLQLLAGDLSLIHADWRGFVINDRGELCTPNNYVYASGDVMAVYWERQLNRALKTKIRQLEKQLATADEQDHQSVDARA